jgi:hypothetical protein
MSKKWEKYDNAVLSVDMIVTLDRPQAYRTRMSLLRDGLDSILKRTKQGDNFGDPDLMDKYYKKWFKTTRKGKSFKKRPMAMVEDKGLKILHKNIHQYLRFPYHPNVYSYESGRSAADCARPHTNKYAVFGIDIKGFFPSFTRSIIEKGYQDLLYYMNSVQKKSDKLPTDFLDILACDLAAICTTSSLEYPDLEEAVLPIGIEPAVTISNGLPIELDIALTEFCKGKKLSYSRYSDNIFLSRTTGHIPRDIQDEVKKIVSDFELYGTKIFKINDSKERYIPYWRQQRILGAVVNEKVNVPKSREIWLRSALNHLYYDCEKFIDDIKNIRLTEREAGIQSKRLVRTYRKTFGNHSYFRAINAEKHMKYSTAAIAVKILIDEIMYMMTLPLNFLEKEEWEQKDGEWYKKETS